MFNRDIHDTIIRGDPYELRFDGGGDKDGYQRGYINIALPNGLPEGLHMIDIGGGRGRSNFL